jgi:uncharacterized membrane protein YedE/YeeE
VIGSRAHQVTRSLIAVSACGLGVRTISGEPITIPPKSMGTGVRYVAGGTIFGLGWALSGACPGPLFALVGNGVTVMIVAIASALAGTWLYAVLRPLPH